MYLGWNFDFGHHWHWHAEQDWPDWDPYYVEIPEDFHLCESKDGQMRYFRGNDNTGYELTISRNSSIGKPVLVGGSHAEMLNLKVLGPVK